MHTDMHHTPQAFSDRRPTSLSAGCKGSPAENARVQEFHVGEDVGNVGGLHQVGRVAEREQVILYGHNIPPRNSIAFSAVSCKKNGQQICINKKK